MIREAMETYETYLQRQPISALTRRSYLQRVARFLEWLAGVPEGEKALTDEVEKNFQVREYKQFMLQRGASPSTINGALASCDNLFLSRGMQAAKVKRLDLPRLSPKALEPEQERRLLKTLMRGSLRNRVLILLLWNSGLRISEAANLNLEDVTMTARTGTVKVKCGKGQKTRVVPINSDLRTELQEYISKQFPRAPHEALFLSQKKSRLSVSSIDRIVREAGEMSGIELSAHSMRHCFASKLMRLGEDVCMIAELLGHSRLETVRRYSLPSEAQKQEAVERLNRAS